MTSSAAILVRRGMLHDLAGRRATGAEAGTA
jgi:hypothetical protein